MNNIDIKVLVGWLGRGGAISGLEKSRKLTIDDLRAMAVDAGIETTSKLKRSEIINLLVKEAAKRINKTLDDLYEMNREELIAYFEDVEVEAPELVDLLKTIDITPGKESRKNLVELVATEISETGRFIRISSRKGG